MHPEPRSSSDEQRDDRRVVEGAVIAGIVSGGTLTAMTTIMSALRGGDVWSGIKATAAPIFGDVATAPGFHPVLVPLGLVLHLVVSIGWALGFAALFSGLSKKATVLAGVLWGFVVWLGMYYVVLPFVGLASIRDAAPLARVLAHHVLFGVSLAVAFLPFQRRQPTYAGGMFRSV